MGASCTFDALHIQTRTAPLAHNDTFTLVKNGSATALSCSLTTSTSGSAVFGHVQPGRGRGGTDLVSLQIVDTTGGIAPVFAFLYGLTCR